MRRTIVWLTAVSLGALRPATGQQAEAMAAEVSLGEAVRRALEVQPAMVQARGDLRDAGAGVRASTGAFLPSLDLNGTGSRRGGTAFDPNRNQTVDLETTTAFSGNLTARLSLFDGFRRLADRSVAAATRDAADAGLVDQRFQVTLQTKRLFYDALARLELVRVAEAQVRRTQQQLQISVDKLRAGSATRSDSLRGVVEHGNARIALLQAQASLATAEANLGRQIGVNTPVRAMRDSALPPPPDTTRLRAEGLDRAPAVEVAEAQARAAGAQVRVNRAAYWPSLSASASGSSSGLEAPWTSTDTYGRGWSMGLSLTWTLFNGFQREQSQVAASVQRDLAESRAADTRRQVNAQLTQQLAALATAYTQIDIARDNLAAATEDLRVQQERYRVGAGTILELLTSQENLTQAEVNRIQTIFNYVLARAELEALVGRAL